MSKSAKHLTEFTHKRCFRDYLEAVEKMDCKEINECWSLFRWITHLKVADRQAPFLDVGSGKRPTLGVMAALMGFEAVQSIDPQLDVDLAGNIQGIDLYPCTLRDYMTLYVDADSFCSPSVLVCNHAHVSRREVVEALYSMKFTGTYVTVPCCVDNTLRNVTGVSYTSSDLETWTPKATAFAYKVEAGKPVNWK